MIRDLSYIAKDTNKFLKSYIKKPTRKKGKTQKKKKKKK